MNPYNHHSLPVEDMIDFMKSTVDTYNHLLKIMIKKKKIKVPNLRKYCNASYNIIPEHRGKDNMHMEINCGESFTSGRQKHNLRWSTAVFHVGQGHWLEEAPA